MLWILYLVVSLLIVILALDLRFVIGKTRAEKYYRESKVKEMNIGETEKLEILPLVDWYTEDEKLKGEEGVSYLIRTDENTILFDLGLNKRWEDPSPLLHNMMMLGVKIEDIDSIVISHNHPDHVGGVRWARRRTFSLATHQLNLDNKKVYTPVPMRYPGLKVIYSEFPTIIGKGVATIGVIPNQLFFLGWTPEQALAVNVKGKGIVVIVGCGHQTLPKIIDRVENLFKEPLYGIVGGLHYPATSSRSKWLGIGIQRYVGTGRPPWKPIKIDDVKKNIELLKKKNPKIVAISAHDSCDKSIELFKESFGKFYKEIVVGRKIKVD